MIFSPRPVKLASNVHESTMGKPNPWICTRVRISKPITNRRACSWQESYDCVIRALLKSHLVDDHRNASILSTQWSCRAVTRWFWTALELFRVCSNTDRRQLNKQLSEQRPSQVPFQFSRSRQNRQLREDSIADKNNAGYLAVQNKMTAQRNAGISPKWLSANKQTLFQTLNASNIQFFFVIWTRNKQKNEQSRLFVLGFFSQREVASRRVYTSFGRVPFLEQWARCCLSSKRSE